MQIFLKWWTRKSAGKEHVFSVNIPESALLSVLYAYLNGIFALQSQILFNGKVPDIFRVFMVNPHIQLIETICNDILPNMVRIFESKKMECALDQDQFVKLIEQKIERANKSLKMLSVEEQSVYRVKIDCAYAENIDRLRKEIPRQTVSMQKNARDYNTSCYL